MPSQHFVKAPAGSVVNMFAFNTAHSIRSYRKIPSRGKLQQIRFGSIQLRKETLAERAQADYDHVYRTNKVPSSWNLPIIPPPIPTAVAHDVSTHSQELESPTFSDFPTVSAMSTFLTKQVSQLAAINKQIPPSYQTAFAVLIDRKLMLSSLNTKNRKIKEDADLIDRLVRYTSLKDQLTDGGVQSKTIDNLIEVTLRALLVGNGLGYYCFESDR